MSNHKTKPALPVGEFVTLMALMMSLVALTIDAMLPALADVGRELQLENMNNTQLIISSIFIGLAIGQLFYGPLSDSIGRKPAVSFGVCVFIVGCLLSMFATTFEMMLVGRLLQGLGLGGPRTVSIALVRDQYSGHEMARIMSFIMMIFILVPMLAPLLGQGILFFATWRAIFGMILGLGLLALIWFQLRQPETLMPEDRRPMSLRVILAATKEILTNRTAFGYTLISGVVFTPFLAYISSVQQVLQIQYELGVYFPLAFGALALVIGLASFVNGRMVAKKGMLWMVKRSVIASSIASVVFSLWSYRYGGHPPLTTLFVYLAILMFCTGILFGNLNSMAMEPLGHIAGIGAAIVGSVSTLISMPGAILIGQAYEGNIMPLILGFSACGLLTLVLLYWVSRSEP
mgnify:CR=1 FL=1